MGFRKGVRTEYYSVVQEVVIWVLPQNRVGKRWVSLKKQLAVTKGKSALVFNKDRACIF